MASIPIIHLLLPHALAVAPVVAVVVSSSSSAAAVLLVVITVAVVVVMLAVVFVESPWSEPVADSFLDSSLTKKCKYNVSYLCNHYQLAVHG